MNEKLWHDGRLGKGGNTKGDGAPQLVFAQVREDAAIELEVLRSLPVGETALCIASGGCTALSLLLAKPAQLHVLDINPTQIYLVELKIEALRHLSYSQLLTCLIKDARSSYTILRPHLSEATKNFWDAQSKLLSQGLNNCGVIENHFRQIMRFLPLAQRRRHIRRMFAAKSLREQEQIYEKHWNHWGWELAFKVALSRPVLQRAYGPQALEGAPPTLALELKRRVDEAFTRYPIQENGYLWQAFRGVYPPAEKALPLYLQPENQEIVRAGLDKIHLQCTDAVAYMESLAAGSVGFFALSNILELASPQWTQRLLRAVAHAAKPGAKICLRSIFAHKNSLFEDVVFENGACLERLPSQELEARDRSVFCKNLLLLQLKKR